MVDAESDKRLVLHPKPARTPLQNSTVYRAKKSEKWGKRLVANVMLILLFSSRHCDAHPNHNDFRQKSSTLVPYKGATIDNSHRAWLEGNRPGLRPLGKNGNRVVLANPSGDEGVHATNIQVNPPSKMFNNEVIFSHKKATALTVLVIIFLTSYLLPGFYLSRYLKGDTPFFLFVATVIGYFGEAVCSSTRKYLSNTVSPLELEESLKRMRSAAPIITWHTECYHYRTRVSYDSRGRANRSRTKVVTHRAKKQFSYRSWIDETPQTISEIAGDAVQVAPYVKVKLSPYVKFANEASLNDYHHQQSQFLFSECRKDTYMDHHTTLEVDGLQRRILVSTTGLGSIIIVQKNYFWLFTLLGLTVPYRRWFSSHCGELDAIVGKQVCT